MKVYKRFILVFIEQTYINKLKKKTYINKTEKIKLEKKMGINTW